MSIETIQKVREDLEKALSIVATSIGKIKIGTTAQFPYGWRKAAKGRTVWRILEEAITQNLEKQAKELGFEELSPAKSEVAVYDFLGKLENHSEHFYVNIKSAVLGGRTNKDDISKAAKLIDFFEEDPSRKLYIASFVMSFEEDMSVVIQKVIVMPIMWLPDIYVNPSNNGNLQSSKYKNLDQSIKRTNEEFIKVLKDELEVARKKNKDRNSK